MDLEKIHKKAQIDARNNKRFLNSLRSTAHRKLDEAFHVTHDEVFEEIDCLECAHCCKTTSPIFYEADIERISRFLKLKPSVFIDQFLRIDEDQDYVLKSSPCPFLGSDNHCFVYNSRPKACREYPHTNRKKMYQLLNLTYKNSLVCPAVLAIVERLKSLEIK